MTRDCITCEVKQTLSSNVSLSQTALPQQRKLDQKLSAQTHCMFHETLQNQTPACGMVWDSSIAQAMRRSCSSFRSNPGGCSAAAQHVPCKGQGWHGNPGATVRLSVGIPTLMASSAGSRGHDVPSAFRHVDSSYMLGENSIRECVSSQPCCDLIQI